MKSDLENLLLQAAGRTGGGSSARPLGRRRQSSYSDASSDSDPEPDNSRYNKKKPPPSSSQVPLKKRHQPERGGRSREYSDEESDGGDSDSAPSVGSDLYKDEDDKEQLEKMSELEREMILAERSTRRDDYHLKKMAMARAQGGKGERGGGGGSSGARVQRDSSPPPPAIATAGRGSAGRTSIRGAEKSAAARSALDELLARRKRKQDPEGYRNHLRNLAVDSLANRDRSPPPLRRRAVTPPSDGGKSDSEDRKDDEFPEDSPRRMQLKFEDIKDITILRSRLLKWFMDPFFEDLLPGCFIRVGIHQHKDGRRKYRLYMVRSVDASDPDKTYKFEHYTTYKYLILVTRTETSIDMCKMAEVSDSPPLENEFKEWLELAEKNGMRIPTRHELVEKKEAIQRALNFVYSAETVKQLLQEKKLASLRPANVAAEKDRLRKELEVARGRHDEPEADRINTRIRKLEQIQPKQVDSKAARLAEMNRRNRAENFKNASEMKPVNTGLKAGEAGYDPFSRRWTRSTNYYVSKPDGEGSSANVETDGGVKGVEETAAAQEAAAGAGKLVDTQAPVDPGTAMYQLHNFEVRIDLTKLQQLGSTPAERVFRGQLLRRQRQEITIGRKMPESDGKRHTLTLSVSDYKRRRGLI